MVEGRDNHGPGGLFVNWYSSLVVGSLRDVGSRVKLKVSGVC